VEGIVARGGRVVEGEGGIVEAMVEEGGELESVLEKVLVVLLYLAL
jgi:hypothetical protein